MEYDIPFMMQQAHILNKNKMLERDMALSSIEMGFKLGFISLEDFEKRNDEIAEKYKPKSWREYLN